MKRFFITFIILSFISKNVYAESFDIGKINSIKQEVFEQQRLEQIRKENLIKQEKERQFIIAQQAKLKTFKNSYFFQSNKKVLIEAVFHEARGETKTGMTFVADVIINRTKSKSFPRTISGVVKNCEFSYFCDKLSNSVPKNAPEYYSVASVAEKVLIDRLFYKKSPNTKALFYHTKQMDISKNRFFGKEFPRKFANCYTNRVVGSHVFKEPTCSRLTFL